MNRRLKWLLIISFIICYIPSKSQTDHFVSLGVTNNQFPFIGYNYNNKWDIYLMNSLFIREFEAQYIRLLVGYEQKFDRTKTDLFILPYFGINYQGKYYDIGLRIKLNKFWISNIETTSEIIPIYDSDRGFHFCYSESGYYLLNNEIFANFKITNYPEFRKPENRILLGLLFIVNSLIVKQEISIPIKGDIRTSRFLMSFAYCFTTLNNNSKKRNLINLFF